MEFEQDFKVYLADDRGLTSNPFVVTTLYPHANRQNFGECFVVLPDGNGLLIWETVGFGRFSAFGTIEITPEMAFGVLLANARKIIRDFVIQSTGDRAHEVMLSRLDLVEDSANLLIHYWLCRQYVDCIQGINGSTQCGKLRGFTDDVCGMDRPTVKRQS